jgi:CrcB protein
MNQKSGRTSQSRDHNQRQGDELDKEEAGLDENYAPPPDEEIDQGSKLETKQTSSTEEGNEQDSFSKEESGLDELFAPPPDENPSEGETYRHSDLERQNDGAPRQQESESEDEAKQTKRSRFLTQLYIYSYLVCFSIFGVLARVGLQALTLYPGALVPNTDLWANFAGCLIIGFLREDSTLFHRHQQKVQNEHKKRTNSSEGTRQSNTDGSNQDADKDTAAIEAAFRASRAQIPAYIGLTVGFCGSFTSFASICRDAFFAISNNINTDDTAVHFVSSSARSREAGYSVMAIMAVLLLEIGLSIVALKMGAHLAIVTQRLFENATVDVSFSKVLNPLFVIIAWGVWIGAVILAILGPHDTWRGKVLFALVFAPVGCILRFQLSVHMNRLVASFPLGTFTANVLGAAILGMSYDLQHSSAARSVTGCQVLQGMEDGFCGALTTVSTWVLELDTLRLRHAYIYGGCSVFIAVGCITAIMGPLRWTEGFMSPVCST